jgi:multicomponent Na+:H+ antiporter subunit A
VSDAVCNSPRETRRVHIDVEDCEDCACIRACACVTHVPNATLAFARAACGACDKAPTRGGDLFRYRENHGAINRLHRCLFDPYTATPAAGLRRIAAKQRGRLRPMAGTHDHSSGGHGGHHGDGHGVALRGRPMGIASRAAFTLLPAAALAILLWALGTFELPQVWRTPWVPSLGIDLAFRFDGLSALMLLLITGVGTGVFIYAGGYLAGHPHQRRLYGALTAFMLAMIGCVTADDLFVLFLFWEMTSLTSFLLVGFNHHDQQSRKSAQQALLVTGSGGLAMFAGFVLLAQAFGTSSISVIIAAAPAAEATPALTAAVALVLVGAFTKSAQVPFHFWLPNAMAAPTPVSAYLHSATMVKLGVYLVARLDPAFGAWPWWQWTLQAVGALTAGWAMVLALRERDLKRILAWSTVATLGTLVLLVGLPGAGATAAVAALLLAHALYKAPLFFVAGNVDHEAGTRIIDRLGNLRRAMPWTATAALLAGLSMAGIPLTFGFVAKDAIHSAKAAEELLPLVQIGYAVFGAIAAKHTDSV